MKESDVRRFKTHYKSSPTVPNDRRLNDELNLGVGSVIDLGDELIADLDDEIYGVGWWNAYATLDRQARILISDYLVSCVRDVSTNLLEAYVNRLELNHALDDFKKYIERGVKKGTIVIPPPRGIYDDLAHFRVGTHFVGILRSLGSSLDCLAGCLVGVAGLPTGIVRTDLRNAKDCLRRKQGESSILGQLHEDLQQCEVAAGPPGWLDWLLGMRNTVVHRGRRVASWNVSFGAHNVIDGFSLLLPRSPELTEVQAWVYADGQVASHFQAPADELLSSLSASVHHYIEDTSKLLIELWRTRKASPSVLAQPGEQWKDPKGLLNAVPSFGGFDIELQPAATGTVRGIAVSDELARRLRAAGLTRRGQGDIHPSHAVWH